MDDEEKGGMKVRDKRRFDSEGREREGGSNETGRGPKEDFTMKGGSGEDSAPGKREGQEMPALDFSSFVMSLATQALMQLGEMKAPGGIDIPVDPAAAKQTIDLISLLKDKTKGNLDNDEQNLLDEILHSLRMSYVRVSK